MRLNNTAVALLIKFVMTFVFTAIAFRFIDANSWGWIFTVAVVATVMNYLLGDLLVLPSMGNVIASIGDGLMGALVAYIVASLTETFNVSLAGLGAFAAFVAIGEYFFHQYLRSADKVAP